MYMFETLGSICSQKIKRRNKKASLQSVRQLKMESSNILTYIYKKKSQGWEHERPADQTQSLSGAADTFTVSLVSAIVAALRL